MLAVQGLIRAYLSIQIIDRDRNATFRERRRLTVLYHGRSNSSDAVSPLAWEEHDRIGSLILKARL